MTREVASDDPPAGPNPVLDILHEDAEILAVNKPSDLVCHPSKSGPLSSLIGRARSYLPPPARLHLINRLDRETSGVVILAKTDSAARELRRLWEERAVEKTYLAILHGALPQPRVEVDAPLGRDESSVVAIKDRVRPDGSPAQTAFILLKTFLRQGASFSLVRVAPVTGRKHQIRIHAAHLGHPVVGDKIYSGDETLYLDFVTGKLTDAGRARLILPWQALHAAETRLVWRNTPMIFRAPPERWFADFVDGRAAEVQPGAAA